MCTRLLYRWSLSQRHPHTLKAAWGILLICRLSKLLPPDVFFSNLTYNLPLEEVIQYPNSAIEASAQVAIDQIRTLDNLDDMPSASLNSSPIINSLAISSPTALALPVTPKSTQDRPITVTPTRHGNSRANVKRSASMRRDSDVNSKPMRPLASFFNEFIQNIRNVTVPQDQPSASDRHLVCKRPLRKASRNGELFDTRPLDWITFTTSCSTHRHL